MKPQALKNSSKVIALAFSGWGLRWEGLIDNRQGEWWLLGQILLISAHLLPAWPKLIVSNQTWPKSLSFLGACLIFVGIVLATKAFLSLGASLSPLPKPKPEACLITVGSYRNVRHPLYQALIICSSGVMISIGSFLHMMLLISLCALLRGKAKIEEEQLKIKHLTYSDYMRSTPAIIPGVPFLDWKA